MQFAYKCMLEHCGMDSQTSMVSLECCCMHVKLAHRKRRQEHLEFKANLGYRGIRLKQVFAVREPLQGFSAKAFLYW